MSEWQTLLNLDEKHFIWNFNHLNWAKLEKTSITNEGKHNFPHLKLYLQQEDVSITQSSSAVVTCT